MSLFSSSRARGQPRASTSTSAPPSQPALQSPGPPTPPQSEEDSTNGRFDKTAIADMKATALDLAKTITDVATEVADVIPVPGLKGGLLGLAAVIRKIQAMQENVEGVATLQQRVGSLVASLHELHAQSGSQPLPDGMKVRIEELLNSWKTIEERARKIKSRGRVARFLRSGRDAKTMGELIGEINDSIQDKVVLQGILNIERYMLDIYEALKKIRTHLEATFMSTYAKHAHYDSNEARNECVPETRVDVLQQIYKWVIAGCAHGERVPKNGIVFWINGLGGTGKTTIAYSVAKWYDVLSILGGTFFCSRFDEKCSNANLIFLTLCRQLSHRHAGFKEKVEVILKEKPDIVNCGPYRQFEELMLRPLEELGSSFPRFVIVLDALDECRDTNATSTILSVIAKYVDRIAPFLLFIVTSRPEEHITAVFDASRQVSLHDTTKHLLLHNVRVEVVTEDIKHYLNHEFDSKVGMLSIKKGWPSAEEKKKLAEQSQGLFIYAATAVKFIMDPIYRNPKGQLRSLLAPTHNSQTPHEFLFALYSRILVASYERASPELARRLRDVLGTVVLAQEPLSPFSVARLVGLDVSDVRNTLSGLHSVLHIPTHDNDPIRIVHPTFPEFLLQSPETIPSEPSELAAIAAPLRLQPAAQHWYMFSRCIEVMTGALKRDMIGIRYPAMFLSEVDNLKEKVNEALEPHVRYVCRFWGVHLRDGAVGGSATPDAYAPLHNFVYSVVLYWIEACSLLDALDRAVFALDAARHACQTLGGQFADLVPLLANCWRFVLDYSPGIHVAPLQIYHCALSLAPTNSPIKQTYAHECQHSLVVDHGLPANWEPCIHAFHGHGGHCVLGVAFSPDGDCFVTAGEDGKAMVWKTATRTLVVSFDGHTSWVNCVAYAPDGLHVASGSDDKRVCVWRASSGECIHTLEGHTGWIRSVAYSEDGRRILSATKVGEVKLWDTTDGRCLLTLDRTGNRTCQAGLSPDGGVIARGHGASVSLYDVSSSTSETLEFPDRVQACTFSPDGRYIAARSEHVIRVWACVDKSLARPIQVSDMLTGRLTFSHDGALIGCGSDDRSVRLWPVASESSPLILEGHTNYVQDLAYSPDRSQAISVAVDGMIRVWDLTSSSTPAEGFTALEPPPSCPGPPRFALVRSRKGAVALLDFPALGLDAERVLVGARAPGGAPTATLFSDVVTAWAAALQNAGSWHSCVSKEWELLTGQRYSRLSWHPLAISPDSMLMACLSPASNKVVDVCDLRTGTVVATLTGNTDDVSGIAFSPDNARVVTGSRDCSVKVWDARIGTLICGHTEHRGWTHSAAFSPDGRLVASGADDNTVRIFEIATERVVRILDSHRGFVMHVTFATDNVRLLALDLSHWVYVWDVTSGVRIREFSLANEGWLRSPLFSPDGTGILVGGDDGAQHTVSLWESTVCNWPVYRIIGDGWVYAMGPGKTRRLCWLPLRWCTALRSDGVMFYVAKAVSEDGPREKRKVIALRMSNLSEYVDALDARHSNPS